VVDLLLASNRGPVSYTEDDDGQLVVRRGGGGLVSALAGVGGETVWVCAALTPADRRAVRTGGVDVAGLRMLDIDEVVFHRAYDRVANSLLWFVAHLLCSPATSPTFDASSRREWAGYETYCAAFADALCAEASPGARVLVQDYHLSLVPAMLRERRPDLRISHFSHTPWAPPQYFRLLPDDVARRLLEGLLGADALGFLSPRWADAFGRCCADVLAANWDGSAVHHAGRTTTVSVHPLGVDGSELRARAAQPDVVGRSETVRETVGDRRLVLRIDRTELSKNIVRGLLAYAELLRTRPQWRERVVHLAFAYPSRHDLPEYREYTAAVQRTAREVNEEFATPGWLPVVLQVRDDYARSLAAYELADVLVVNPVRDGMNLVAKEGPVLSRDGLALVLSREAGAADQLGGDALMVNPYDVSQTAEAMHRALLMPRDERLARCDRLAAAATALPPSAWLAAQLAALD
jgi:trehalose 6-phosphate synthase